MASRAFKAGLLASGQMLTVMAGMIIGMVLSRALSKLDYATYRQTLLAYNFAAPLLLLGLPKVLFVFIPRVPEAARRQLVTNLLLLAAMGALFGLALLAGGADLLAARFKNPQLRETLPLLAPYAIFMFPTTALAACLMARDKPAWVAGFNVLSRGFILLSVVGACLIWPTPEAAVIATVVAAGLMTMPAITLMLKVTRGTASGPKIADALAQLRFSVPLGLGGALGTLNLTLDKLIVSSMAPPEDFAIYVNGAFELPFAMVIASAVGAVLLPDMAGMVERGDRAQALKLWQRAAAKTAAVILPTMIGVFMMAPEFITILFSDRYAASVGPFRYYLLLLPARVVVFSPMFMAANQNHLIFVRAGSGLAINAAISVAFVNYFGYLGAAMATVLVFYLWLTPFNLLFICRHYDTTLRAVLPWRDLWRITWRCGVAALVLVPNLFIEGWAPLTRALLFAPPYVALAGYLLLQARLLDRRLLDRIKGKIASKRP